MRCDIASFQALETMTMEASIRQASKFVQIIVRLTRSGYSQSRQLFALLLLNRPRVRTRRLLCRTNRVHVVSRIRVTSLSGVKHVRVCVVCERRGKSWRWPSKSTRRNVVARRRLRSCTKNRKKKDARSENAKVRPHWERFASGRLRGTKRYFGQL